VCVSLRCEHPPQSWHFTNIALQLRIFPKDLRSDKQKQYYSYMNMHVQIIKKEKFVINISGRNLPKLILIHFCNEHFQILLTLVAIHSHLDRNIYLHLQAQSPYQMSPSLWTRDRRYNCILKIHWLPVFNIVGIDDEFELINLDEDKSTSLNWILT
jgi:hypothetical protein